VALSELDRLGHSQGEFSVYSRWLQRLWDAEWSLDVVEVIEDSEQVESCILNDVWAILHGVSLPKRSQRQQEALLAFNRPESPSRETDKTEIKEEEVEEREYEDIL
jgi:hypothetical protein